MKFKTNIFWILNLTAVSFIVSFTVSFSAFAQPESCAQKQIKIYGKYGKYNSPLLETYSESSGNLTELSVQSKIQAGKIQLVWKNEKNDVVKIEDLKLLKNKTAPFHLIKKISEFKIRPKHLGFIVLNESDDILCAMETDLIERDGQDGVLKK